MVQKKRLKGIKVIDLSTVLAGPSVGSFFAELGAEVIKIEHPKHPDITRSWKLPTEGKAVSISAYFSSINYKKTYRKIDYGLESGRLKLLEAIKDADIVLMNFKPGLQKKLGLSDTDLKACNPELIIGKITGFGEDSDRVAYDLILQAETGFMSMNGTPESGPVKMPVALIDVLAAHHLREGLLLALLEKAGNKKYRGAVVEASLYDAAVSSLVNQASNYLMENHIPQRIGSLHPNIAPYGELFKTADQRLITFAIGSSGHFQKLCRFLNIREVAEDKSYRTIQARITNRSALFELLKPAILKYEAEILLKEMRKRNIPCGEVKNLQAVFKDESAKRLIREEEIDGTPTKRMTGVAFVMQDCIE